VPVRDPHPVQAAFQQRLRLFGKRRRQQDRAVGVNSHERRIEGRIDVRGEKEAVVDVEPFLVSLAVGPGLRVACAKERAVRNARDRAATAPIVFEGGAEDVLSDPLLGEALDLGALGHGPGLLAVGRKRGIGQGPYERRGAADGLVRVRAARLEQDQAAVPDGKASTGPRVLRHLGGDEGRRLHRQQVQALPADRDRLPVQGRTAKPISEFVTALADRKPAAVREHLDPPRALIDGNDTRIVQHDQMLRR